MTAPSAADVAASNTQPPRKLVGGQEDMIEDAAITMARERGLRA